MGKIYELALDKKSSALVEKHKTRFRFYYHPIRKVWYATELALLKANAKGVRYEILVTFDSDQTGIKIIDMFPASLRSTPPDTTKDEVIALSLASEKNGEHPTPIYLGRNIELKRHPGAFILDIPGGKRKYAWRFPQIGENIEHLSVADHFPKLLNMIKDPDTKFIVSLGGGGLKVYAQAVLFRLIDALGVKDRIDEIWGTSAGAIGALWYSCDVPVTEMEQSGYDLYNKRYSLKLTPSPLSVIKNLLVQHVLPPAMRPSGFAGFLDSAKSIYDFIFKIKQYRQPRIPFFCIAFNINEFRPEILTPLRFNIKEYEDIIFTVDPIEAAIASSSVPVLFVPKVIKRDNKAVTYIDGMATESVPMISIYKKWCIDRELGIEKRSKLCILAAKFAKNTLYETQPTKRIDELKMMMIYHDALTNAMVESQRTLIEGDKDVELIEIATPLSEWNNFDTYGIPTFIRESYVHFINDLLMYEGQKPIVIKD
jgi:hypothetical protein